MNNSYRAADQDALRKEIEEAVRQVFYARHPDITLRYIESVISQEPLAPRGWGVGIRLRFQVSPLTKKAEDEVPA